MNHEQGCADCTDWGNGNCTSGCFGPVCTCTELQRMTVCHDMRNEPHVIGCPRWGTRKLATAAAYGHDCEHTSMQHGADGCNVPGCLCAFMSWGES